MRSLILAVAAAALCLAAVIGWSAGPAAHKAIAVDRPETKTDGKLTVASPAFKEGQPIPARHSQAPGHGQNVSPELKWTGAPKETQSFAVILEDPDAPLSQPFVHWIIYDIPPEARGLPEAVPPKDKPEKPAGALQGRNTARRIGYFGPRPPQGDKPHHYHFQVFALDAKVDLKAGANLDDLLKSMQGHVLAKGQTIGTFQIK